MPLRRLVNRLSLRARLTVWVVGVSTILKLTVAVVFYLYQSSAVNSFFNDYLVKRTDAMLGRLAAQARAITRDDLQEISAIDSRDAMFPGFLLSVYDSAGNLVVTMRRDKPRYPISDEALRKTAADGSVWFVKRPATEYKRIDPATDVVRTVVRGYSASDGQRYTLVATASDQYARQMVGLVLRALLVVVPTGVLISGVSGWFIAGLAVRPLEQVRRVASQLSPESIDRRMTVGTTSPELNRLEQELESARIRLATAFAAQERFMSNVSHEVKTPIAVMLTEAQTLDLRSTPPEVAAYIRSAAEELRRLGGMVDSFLLLTRVREGRSLSQSRVYPINELVMESVAHCGTMAEQYGVRIEPTLCGDDLAVCVRGDPTLLRTMLDNLVRNAIRFSPRGQPVHLSATCEDDGVLIRVRDFGAGIPESVIQRIFDRFVQAPEEHRRGRGHGLGLEIAQGIAELHGGRISVRNCGPAPSAGGEPAPDLSPEQAGCEFTVWLPRAQETPEVHELRTRKTVIGPSPASIHAN